MTTKRIIELWASEDRKLIACEDFTKCGACWKEELRANVANEFLKAGKVADSDLGALCLEVDRRYKETAIYKEVKAMMNTGKSLDEIEQIMAEKGVSI